MSKIVICIEVEDLHEGVTFTTGQHLFASYKAAERYCEKLNQHYIDNCVPRVASVKELVYG